MCTRYDCSVYEYLFGEAQDPRLVKPPRLSASTFNSKTLKQLCPL